MKCRNFTSFKNPIGLAGRGLCVLSDSINIDHGVRPPRHSYMLSCEKILTIIFSRVDVVHECARRTQTVGQTEERIDPTHRGARVARYTAIGKNTAVLQVTVLHVKTAVYRLTVFDVTTPSHRAQYGFVRMWN